MFEISIWHDDTHSPLAFHIWKLELDADVSVKGLSRFERVSLPDLVCYFDL